MVAGEIVWLVDSCIVIRIKNKIALINVVCSIDVVGGGRRCGVGPHCSVGVEGHRCGVGPRCSVGVEV